MLQNPLILTALVTSLGHGADDTRQKAAVALGNLAWRSEARVRDHHGHRWGNGQTDAVATLWTAVGARERICGAFESNAKSTLFV